VSVMGKPNVITIILDDTGFGQLGCFGSEIATPRLDALAAGGLRYNRFHVTAMCSPTRASLLTGRNHHAVGYGFLADIPLSTPGYTARIPHDVPTLPEVLRTEGYATYAVGKWHLTPRYERSPAGPFDTWPLARGFDRFYGFLQGDTSQYAPNLVVDNHYVDPPATPAEGYHLTEDLVDQARRLIIDLEQHAPGKPFFLNLALGAMHAPHHVSREWSDRYLGQFDDGWDRLRERTFERQKELGVVPPDAVLTTRPPWVRAWDDVPDNERALLSRQQEVFAGFLSHTDFHIGRLVDLLAETGQLDNTIILVLSDNGASAEGGVDGTYNEHEFTSRLGSTLLPHDEARERWGDERTYPHYSWGWAHAGNTPFRLWKRYTWLGGTRTPLIVHWPRGIATPGEVRDTFVHAIDVMPTLVEALRIEREGDVTFDGASFAATFVNSEYSGRSSQYFELLGSRSMIDGRWKATTNHVSEGVPDEEELMTGSRDFDEDLWSLFDLTTDFSESRDLADEHPEVVRHLAARWEEEASRNNVLPLSDSIMSRAVDMVFPRFPPRSTMVYRPDGGPITDESLPFLAFGFSVRARCTFDLSARGVIYALGDWSGGLALHVSDGIPEFHLSRASELFSVLATESVTPGEHVITTRYVPGEPYGQLTLEVDDIVVGVVQMTGALPIVFQHGGAALRLGFDVGLPVSASYVPPARFSGIIHEVVVSAESAPPPGFMEQVAQALHAD